MQIVDPDAFAGRETFLDQVSFFADQCRKNPPIDPERPVRLPGEQARGAWSNGAGATACPWRRKPRAPCGNGPNGLASIQACSHNGDDSRRNNGAPRSRWSTSSGRSLHSARP
jgi:hypothetical protein